MRRGHGIGVFRFALAAAPVMALGGLLSACPGLEKIEQDGDESIPPAVQQALDESCGTPGCHAASGAAAGLVLTAPESAAILDSTAQGYPLVEFGDIEGSYLAIKILDLEGISGSPMPSRAPRPEDETNLPLIIGWIAGLDVGSEDTEGPDCVLPAADPVTVGYTDHVWPIFEAKCGGGACHVDSDQGDLQLSEDNFETALIDAVSTSDYPQVVAGDPDGSYLWHRLLGTGDLVPNGKSSVMPIGDVLCGEELALIYRWILDPV
jgi:hypothetical protein